ncbi:unnamed protein product [Darwinula stevensoni]|uniref:Sodium/calcium exchanger membrane region domain-containing protein n=1 Tax=Darwinula stevensoni TaxID=69355 RepID=A0A7R8XDE4_9CRUS|nr:unnamed protein product [Darwinula stevensoni]CAG0888556.1 unnamed protein product [Darwinula stevensoni]
MHYWGGWLSFLVAILWIGVLTAVIGDLAGHFGCTIGLKDSITAISFVALGTSIPGNPSITHYHPPGINLFILKSPSYIPADADDEIFLQHLHVTR